MVSDMVSPVGRLMGINPSAALTVSIHCVYEQALAL